MPFKPNCVTFYTHLINGPIQQNCLLCFCLGKKGSILAKINVGERYKRPFTYVSGKLVVMSQETEPLHIY